MKDKKTSIEAISWRSDRVLADSFTEVMPEADAEALRHALRKIKSVNAYNFLHVKQKPNWSLVTGWVYFFK
ncbi:hypothetical protein BCE02nite_16130 [Brevibacillus centrosporus]|nr:hypothetical protein EDM55_08740 [Brevibacillus centrosporus]GED30472.1 hypothetical protein BCE02nite_16130 [Brevibacillus centrosporus]